MQLELPARINSKWDGKQEPLINNVATAVMHHQSPTDSSYMYRTNMAMTTNMTTQQIQIFGHKHA